MDSPAFYLKHGVSETGFSLRLQMEPTQLGLRHISSLLSPDTIGVLVGVRRQSLALSIGSN
jgi:hypothetical protein